MKKTCLLFLALVFRTLSLLFLGNAFITPTPIAVAQDEPPFVAEGLPADLARVVERQQATVLPPELRGGPSDLLVSRLKLWPREYNSIRVCFFGGSQELRQRIVEAAGEWTRHGARIPLDFGETGNPRTCLSNDNTWNHIRIGFAYPGYWSLVGTDSERLTGQLQQSMNFFAFDLAPPPEPEFTQIVLHEFGHALGFEHEHQNPWSRCGQEFDWPAVYAYLAGPPNYWTRERVDFNMRALHRADLASGGFDPESIMLYSFPVRFYRVGRNATCYSEGNVDLSSRDIALAQEMYPTDAAVAVEQRRKILDDYQNALISAEKVLPEARLRALGQVELFGPTDDTPAERLIIQERLLAR